MEQNLVETIALLTRTPAALDVLLRDLPEAWTSHDEGENTWDVFGVVGHLIHGERTDLAHQYRDAVGPWSKFLAYCNAPAIALDRLRPEWFHRSRARAEAVRRERILGRTGSSTRGQPGLTVPHRRASEASQRHRPSNPALAAAPQ